MGFDTIFFIKLCDFTQHLAVTNWTGSSRVGIKSLRKIILNRYHLPLFILSAKYITLAFKSEFKFIRRSFSR